MARQRASQARDAFARVGTAPVSAAADDDASLSAGINAGDIAVSDAGGSTGRKARGGAGPRAGRATGKKSRPVRRVGRPRGPERVALTVRILAATNDRLTTAVETTGQSPQYVVDAALAAYLDALGI